MLEKTTTYAIKTHQAVNHKYGDHGYEFHLQMVHEVAEKFIYLVAEEERENVLCACWVHDIIEDARETYNDVMKNTNEKGKNRNERASDKYYQEMQETPNAVFIKYCDRIANIMYSKKQRSGMFGKYKKENDNFIRKTFRPELLDMVNYIETLLENE